MDTTQRLKSSERLWPSCNNFTSPLLQYRTINPLLRLSYGVHTESERVQDLMEALYAGKDGTFTITNYTKVCARNTQIHSELLSFVTYLGREAVPQ